MLELNFSSSYQFGDDTVTKSGHVRILNHDFVAGQSEYTMTVRCDYNGSVQTITYKYEATDEDGIPAGYVCGASPAYLCMYGRQLSGKERGGASGETSRGRPQERLAGDAPQAEPELPGL